MTSTAYAPPHTKKRASSYDPAWPRNERGRFTERSQKDSTPWVNIPSGSGSPASVSVTQSSAPQDLAALRESVRTRSRASSRAGSVASGKKTPSIPEHVEVDQSVSPIVDDSRVPVYDQNGSFMSARDEPSTPAPPQFNMALGDTPPRDNSLMDQMQQDLDDSLSQVSRTTSFERRLAEGLLLTQSGNNDLVSTAVPALPFPNEPTTVPSDANATNVALSAKDDKDDAFVSPHEISHFKQYCFISIRLLRAQYFGMS